MTSSEIQIGVLNDATNTALPGLGAEYVDTAKAFTNWCNAAGGINGRKIKFVSRDAQLTQGPARVVDACQSDFMLVGGATPIDDATTAPRLKCGLGAIPAYAVSAAAINSPLSALAFRTSTREANVMLVNRLLPQYRDALQSISYLAVDTPSLLGPTEATARAIAKAGGQGSDVKIPLSATSLRTYIQPLVGHSKALAMAPIDPLGVFRAVADSGFAPDVIIDPGGVAYTPATTKALKAVPQVNAPFYTQTNFAPLFSDQSAGTQLAIDLVKKVNPGRDISSAIMSSYAAWILWAQSATACGSTLTPQCVTDKAKTQTNFDAGGLIAPVNVADPQAASPCGAILKVTADGFTYDPALTRPNHGVFNCDPANVVAAG